MLKSLRMMLLASCVLSAGQNTTQLSAQEHPAERPAETRRSTQETAEEIGSLRNAKVAFPMGDQRSTVTFFAGGMSEATRAELSKIAPNVKIVTGLSAAEALARAEEAHGIDVRYANPEFLARAKNLVWIQAMSAGVERLVSMDAVVQNDSIVLTNFRGVHGPTIADHAMAMLLSLTRELPLYTAADARRSAAREVTGSGPIALEGKTMLVVGIGGIGTEIAQRGHGFGMRIIGTRRSATPGPDYIEKVGKPSDLLSLLPEADVVAIAVPLTAETENLFNAEAFAAMKPGSYLINIARGKVVNTEALVDALSSKKLAGACLDVTDPEPLPSDHALRRFPNVIVTPHVAGVSEVTRNRGTALLTENLRRFGAGEPLLNVVDKQAGY